ncbi:MAG TPA: 4Fe-4S dicluster domain-containing protein [Anaeromyxobacteraceae bacterium]|nr:4Fe-4S dicluster domain-containing protein [Anaeromyxobacteraceae bacterium]
MVEIRFRAQVDLEKCVSCPMCENVCPTGAITLPRKGAKAEVVDEKCVGCPNCSGVCPVDAIALVAREAPLLLGVDLAGVDEAAIAALCRKAHLHPQQWLCLCTATRVQEGAAAILKGARTLEEVALATGTRSGCTIYCLQPTLRLLKAHGVEVVQPEGYRWYNTSQTCWDVPQEVVERYPGHFLEEDKDVFRKI